MAKIIVIEDDESIRELVKVALQGYGHEVLDFECAEDALEELKHTKADLGIFDIMLPGIDGVEAVKEYRSTETNGHMAIIMLTAKDSEVEKIIGLDSGADDYVTKPFNPLELVARVKSNLRRYTQLGSLNVENNALYQVGGLCMNDDTKEVTVDGEPVKLTPIEYNILFLLVKNQGKVFSIDQIYENIWNEEAIGADNTVAVHIRHIREKIEINPKEPRYLKVVWGVGYKVEKQ